MCQWQLGPGGAEAAELAAATRDFLKALASATGQRIKLLFARGAELSVNEVAEHASVGQSAAFQQLDLLRRAAPASASTTHLLADAALAAEVAVQLAG